MQYCINALLKNNNEIMQYYIINNDIALIMHYCALLQMPGYYISPSIVGKNREENIVKIGVEFIFSIEKEGQTSLSLGKTGIIYSCSMCLVYVYML